MLVAAGGGGSGDCNDEGSPKSAGSGSCETKEEGAGTVGENTTAGGAGFATDSVQETKSFLNGGQGGITKEVNCGYGGFGGGGSPNNAGGGGGGFKGGNSCSFAAAGTGGYSFGADKAVYYLSGSNAGNGFVTIVFKNSLNNCSCKRRTSNSMQFAYYE